MTLLLATACWKLGCCSWQLPASERPVMVNRSSTPPFGLLVSGCPFCFTKNGKRASRVGPVAVMKGGVVSLGATVPAKANCGFIAGPEPPDAGWAWQDLHELELNRGPRPLLPVGLLVTDSTSAKRFWPSSKNAA